MLADHLGPLADEVRRFEESISNIMSDTASMAQQKGGDFEVQNVLRSRIHGQNLELNFCFAFESASVNEGV